MSFSSITTCLAAALALAPLAISQSPATASPTAESVAIDLAMAAPASPETLTTTEPERPLAVDVHLSPSEQRFAERVTRALAGTKSAGPRPVAAEPSASAPKRQLEWVCGEWQDLWQGRGRAKTCEWR